jgi:hypothetical protein
MELTVDNPSAQQEFPFDADIVVGGRVVGTWGAEPHPIESVTVRVAGQPAVDVELTQVPGPRPLFLTMAYKATVRLNRPGAQQVTTRSIADFDMAHPLFR